jgi:hypothetical protein
MTTNDSGALPQNLLIPPRVSYYIQNGSLSGLLTCNVVLNDNQLSDYPQFGFGFMMLWERQLSFITLYSK